jgi:hypothetical protein
MTTPTTSSARTVAGSPATESLDDPVSKTCDFAANTLDALPSN